jgi:hypothetical protein
MRVKTMEIYLCLPIARFTNVATQCVCMYTILAAMDLVKNLGEFV